MADRYKFSPGRKEPAECGHLNLPCWTNGNNTELAILLAAYPLPGYNVGVMLHTRQDDFISRLYECSSIRKRHQVNGLGDTPYKNDFFLMSCVDKLFQRHTCIFKGAGSALGQRMNATMNVGIVLLIVI